MGFNRLLVALAIVAAVLVVVQPACASVQFIPGAEKLPPNHPIIVIVNATGAKVDVTISALLSVECESPVSLPSLPETPPWSYTGLPVLPVSFNESLYWATVVPGLPAAKVKFSVVVPGVPPRL